MTADKGQTPSPGQADPGPKDALVRAIPIACAQCDFGVGGHEPDCPASPIATLTARLAAADAQVAAHFERAQANIKEVARLKDLMAAHAAGAAASIQRERDRFESTLACQLKEEQRRFAAEAEVATLTAERDAALSLAETARATNRKLHRRCQQAEGKLQRAQTWINMRDEPHEISRRSPYVRREMDHFYLAHILAELKRPNRALAASGEAHER